MCRKLLLCLLVVSALILFAHCDNSSNGINNLGGDDTGENLIVLHPNGGEGSIESIPFKVGDVKKIPYNEDEIVRDGYTFIIWNTESDGSGEEYGRKDYIEPEVSGTINLYAQWYKHYAIGDLGPQGGRVFYSRIEDGKEEFDQFPAWLYLEVAPKELHAVGEWASTSVKVGVTGIGIGEGKSNTDLIIEKHGENCIAYKCKYPTGAVDSSGWYLPSRLELGYLYKNIFEHEDYPVFDLDLESSLFYWSSSEGFEVGGQGSSGHAAVFLFQSGYGFKQVNHHEKNHSYNARSIRQF